MGLRVRTNTASLNAQRQMQKTTKAMGENSQKLASGYRINKAADDAAGLAISQKMKAKIGSLEQAKRNANDGISLIQTAEGSMNEISNILIRMRELATQSASDTVGDRERSYTNREYVQLVNEIERISNTTEFNGTPLLKGQDAVGGEEKFSIHVGSGDGTTPNTDTITVGVEDIKITLDKLNLGTEAEIGPLEPGEEFERATAASKLETIDKALDHVANSRAYLGAQQSRLDSTINNLGIQTENLKSANSRIRDVDFAAETARYTQNRILQQAGASVLSQANSQPEIALSLLR